MAFDREAQSLFQTIFLQGPAGIARRRASRKFKEVGNIGATADPESIRPFTFSRSVGLISLWESHSDVLVVKVKLFSFFQNSDIARYDIAEVQQQQKNTETGQLALRFFYQQKKRAICSLRRRANSMIRLQNLREAISDSTHFGYHLWFIGRLQLSNIPKSYLLINVSRKKKEELILRRQLFRTLSPIPGWYRRSCRNSSRKPGRREK